MWTAKTCGTWESIPDTEKSQNWRGVVDAQNISWLCSYSINKHANKSQVLTTQTPNKQVSTNQEENTCICIEVFLESFLSQLCFGREWDPAQTATGSPHWASHMGCYVVPSSSNKVKTVYSQDLKVLFLIYILFMWVHWSTIITCVRSEGNARELSLPFHHARHQVNANVRT